MEQADQENEDDGEDDAEPEDDFNAAWEVLDLARAIFEKHQEDSDELKMKLAETYIVLGDVSLETGQYHMRFPICLSFDLIRLYPAYRKIRPSYH